MKKTTTKKLTLDREVLIPLQRDALDAIGGGVGGLTVGGATRNCGGTQFYCVPKTGTLTG
ncbi:MAG: class I lanthipeptide [Deltaproteobacteria bacterium]|nr:class I lanthipeptide [Deltaproteobacteria bacterium]